MTNLILAQASKLLEIFKQELFNNSQILSISIQFQHIRQQSKQYLDLLADHLINQKHYYDIQIRIQKNKLLGDKGYKILAQSLKAQSKVQIIKLYLEKSCQIGLFGLLSLSETIKFKEIFDLAIIINGNNYIRNDGLKYLSRIFPQLPKLKRLQIQIAQPNRYDQIGVIEIYDNIKILGVEAIAQALLSLTNLQILNFRINDGLGLIEGAKDLAFALGQLVELKQLKFSISPQNLINSEIQVEFSNSFRNLKKIESFQIEGLYFLDKQSIISFTDIFNGLSQLKKLSLQIESSKINGQYAVLSLSNSLKNLENLSDFQITINDSCNIGVEGSLALAQAIKFMKKLTKLSIFIDRNNKIGCKGAISIGEAQEELKNQGFQNQIQVVTIICTKKELLQQCNVFNKYQAQMNYMYRLRLTINLKYSMSAKIYLSLVICKYQIMISMIMQLLALQNFKV
ncbi:hypothetical protein ABPG72_020484 [Tetrahymena utriculariae]